jgi:tRNA nucleotidyltransferase (CCA-adding enzyme)
MCNPQKVRPRVPIQIRAEAADRELLFADWLNQILYEIDTQKMYFSRFEIRLENNSLTGTAWGEPADPDRHESAVDVKAATYLMLKVNCQGDRWIAQCVVDV